MPTRRRPHLRLQVILVFMSSATLLVGCGAGQQDAADTSQGLAFEKLDPADLERWADEVFGSMVAEHRASALAISVTHEDEVLFKKGYGYSDWPRKTPVDPDVSQFRIGSLTKPFFATAIAQLLERGLIDSLDDPVNKYLKRVQVDNPFGEEITIWDMLTHQGGMASSGSRSTFVSGSGDQWPPPPLSAQDIAANLPPVVREPGSISMYCNACSATLGFMVEDITGDTLEEYLRENIYGPLGMRHTTLINSPEAPNANVVTQYAFAAGHPPVALPYPSVAPHISYAGDINSTAGDMALWIKAHVMAGRGTGPVILKPKTFDLMHARKRGNHPDASGFGMQFFTYDYNDEPVIEHYGSIQFRSMEIMMLDQKIGVFVTMGGGGEAGFEALGESDRSLDPVVGPVLTQASHSGVRALVLAHFLGPLSTGDGMAVDVGPYTGVYRSTPVDPGAVVSGEDRLVEDSGDGGLIIGGIGVYRPSGPHTFTLEGQLPVEAGFGESNRFIFAPGNDGGMRMFAHVNAGVLERSGGAR